MIIMITNNQVPVGILQASQGKTQGAQRHNWEGDFYVFSHSNSLKQKIRKSLKSERKIRALSQCLHVAISLIKRSPKIPPA